MMLAGDSALEKAHWFIASALLLLLPFQAYVLPAYPLIALALSSILWQAVHGWPLRQIEVRRQGLKSMLPLLLWWIPLLLGAMLHPMDLEGWALAGEQVPLWAFPLVWLTGPRLQNPAYKQLLLAFVIGVGAALIGALGLAVLNYFENVGLGNRMPVENLLGYHPLAEPLDMTASYLALYTAMAFFVLWLPPLRESTGKFTRFFGLLFFFGLMFLIAARAQILAFGVVFILLLGHRFVNKFGAVRALAAIAVVVATMVALALLPPRTRQRAQETLEVLKQANSASQSDYRDARLFIWNRALNQFAEKPVLGWGAGSGWRVFQDECERELLDRASLYSTQSIVEHPFKFSEAFILRYRRDDLEAIEAGVGAPSDSAWRGLMPGVSYGLHFQAFNREAGGLDFANGPDRVAEVREEAAGSEGVKKTFFFSARGDALHLQSTTDPLARVTLGSWELFRVNPSEPTGTSTPIPPTILGNYMEVIQEQFQLHNQYLSYMLDTGLLGLLLLVVGFGLMFTQALREKQPLLLAWVLLIALSFFTEHLLLRQAGLFFTAVFGGLWTIAPHQNNTSTER